MVVWTHSGAMKHRPIGRWLVIAVVVAIACRLCRFFMRRGQYRRNRLYACSQRMHLICVPLGLSVRRGRLMFSR